MDKGEDTILVFTSDSHRSIIDQRESGAWKLSAPRARRCTWLVCARKRLAASKDRFATSEPHRAGFLLARISQILPAAEAENDGRWTIAIDKYASIDRPDLWDGGQNPVRYTSLAALGIDPASLVLQPSRLWEEWSSRLPRNSGLAGLSF